MIIQLLLLIKTRSFMPIKKVCITLHHLKLIRLYLFNHQVVSLCGPENPANERSSLEDFPMPNVAITQWEPIESQQINMHILGPMGGRGYGGTEELV